MFAAVKECTSYTLTGKKLFVKVLTFKSAPLKPPLTVPVENKVFKIDFFVFSIMSKDLKIKLPADKGKIDVNEPGEIIWWSNHLGVGLEIIFSLVKKVGNSAELVRKELRS